jgi:hypothetical protein
MNIFTKALNTLKSNLFAKNNGPIAQKSVGQMPGLGAIGNRFGLGASGTDIQTGIINEDYNLDWNYPNSVANADEMRKSDAQVRASLQVVKKPIQTANWVIEMDEDGDEKIKEFIEDQMFSQLDFEAFVEEATAFLDFGFYYFEKIFGLNKDGRIVWKDLAARIPSAHLYWPLDSKKPEKGFIVQQLKANETASTQDNSLNPKIPWKKIILFNHEQEGKNWEGISILRSSYKHWKMKSLAEKVQMIAIERFGVGIPTMKLPKNAGDTDKTSAEDILKNLRSNEKGYVVINNDWEFEIKAIEGSAKEGQIKDTIDYHNRMILMNVLANFMDLGSGATGSFALGETQMNFFANSLQNIAKRMGKTMDKHIKELVIMNFGEQEHYPKLRATEIGDIDKGKLMTAMATAMNAGLIVADDTLKDWTRENMNLPEREEEVEEEIIEPDMKDKKEDDKKIEEKKEDKKLSSKKKISILAEKITTSKREGVFQTGINDYEKNLEEAWQKQYLPEIVKTEKQLKAFLTKQYGKAKTEKVAGIVVIATKGNSKLLSESEKGVNQIMKKLDAKFMQKNFQDRLMNESAKSAKKVLTQMSRVKEFTDIFIDESTINAFTKGHISNVRAFVFNEGRRVREKLISNFSEKSSINLVLAQTKKIKMNRNITKLSVVTHPRALFKNAVFTNAEKQGVKKFKVLIPDNKRADLNPSGITAGLLFTILTFQQLNKKANIKENANNINGMGSHHGSFDYAYPIDPEFLTEEEELAKEQRSEFLQSNQ